MFFLAVNCCYCGAMRREAAAMTARRFLPGGFAALILQLAAVEAYHGQSDSLVANPRTTC
jgi:hypothetical protein